MQLKKTFFSLTIAAAFFTSQGTITLISAQDTDDELEFILEDIVVTAEKRTADIQKTPLPISAITGDSLNRSNVLAMFDLDKVMPELEIYSGGAGSSVIAIRGVRPGEWGPFAEMPNVVHIDGAVITRPNAIENLFFDIERVEVLKGPQGTLYGRGASAGVMNIISRKPSTDAFSGNAEVEFGNYNLMRVGGAVNLPVNDKLAIRAAFRSVDGDGYWKGAVLGNKNSSSQRFSLLYEPNDRSSLLLTADYETHNIYDSGGGWTGSGSVFLGSYGDLTITTPPDPIWDRGELYDGIDRNVVTDADHWGMMGQYDYELDFATLTVQASHRSFDEARESPTGFFGPGRSVIATEYDADGLITEGYLDRSVRDWPTYSYYNVHWSSLEARMASKATEPLKWIGGVYLYDESIYMYEILIGEFLIDPMDKSSKAIFGEATWTPTGFDRLHITAGARMTDDEVELLVDDVQPIEPPTGPATTADFSKTTYKINLSYDFTDSNMVYAQYSTGFKAGYISTTKVIVPPETLKAYEIGTKNRFLDNRLQVNAEAYLYDYVNYQWFISATWCLLDVNNDHICEDWNGDGVVDGFDQDSRTTTVNPGGAEFKGAQLSLSYLITPKDRVNANFAYTSSRYKDYDIGAALLAQFPDADNAETAGDQSNRKFVGFGGGPVPFRGNIGYTRSFDIGDEGLLEVTADLYYEGENIDREMRINTPEEYAMPGNDDYWLGDISARYSSSYGMPEGMLWHVRAWINNVWNSTHTSILRYSDSAFGGAYPYAPQSGLIWGAHVYPRTFGIAFGANW